MTKTLGKGLYIQVYRGAMKGTPAEKTAKLVAAMDKWKALGVTGVAWHGFVGDLSVAEFAKVTKLCKDRGMKSLAAFGLGSTRPVDYGNWIGDLANAPDCDGVVFDMEGAWEDEQADKAKAKLMGDTFRAKAPNALAIDQPWPVPTLHWSMFPWEESAEFIDIRAPQYYCNNWRNQWGKEAYEKCWKWFDESWVKLNARLAPKNLVRPVIPTIQGYYWDLTDLVNCLTSFDTMIVWSEPFPDATFLVGLDAWHRLQSLGFTGPKAVEAFQASWNKAHPTDLLTVDNGFGPKTAAKLGVDLSTLPKT